MRRSLNWAATALATAPGVTTAFGSSHAVLEERATAAVYNSSWHPAQYTMKQANAKLSTASICCAGLSLFLGNKISYPDTTVYDASLGSYWSVQEEEVTPTCIFSPASVTDVSLAVFLLNLGGKLGLSGCEFAIRSGGHTPFAGAANIEEGITFDLNNLDTLTVTADKKTVNIGTANRWEDVYLYLDAQGLATSGGRVAIVGVGGLITGGGISFFSPRYGFVCDNVENFQVVLASGQVVNANATSNADLWRGLRGGSNNLGIVTTFTMRTFEQGDFWGGFIGFSIDTIDEQFQAFVDLTGSPTYDPYASLIFNLVYTPSTNSWYTASNFEYTQPVVNPPVFQNFTSLPQTFSTMRISNLTDFTVELSASNPAGNRQLFATGTYGNSKAQMAAIYSYANSTVQSVKDAAGLAWSISYQPIPTVITEKAAQNGGNVLGLTPEDGDLFNVLLTATWANEADDAAINAAAQSLFSQAETNAKALGVYNEYIYLNYAAPWQDPIDGYNATNVAFLKATSKKYDPVQMFQSQVPGGFKL